MTAAFLTPMVAALPLLSAVTRLAATGWPMAGKHAGGRPRGLPPQPPAHTRRATPNGPDLPGDLRPAGSPVVPTPARTTKEIVLLPKPPCVPPSPGRLVALLAAGYALGSNLWLSRYGPEMLRFCANMKWLGKRAHRVIQAHVLPDYFALQTLACALMLLGLLTADPEQRGSRPRAAWVAASIAFTAAVANFCVLSPAIIDMIKAWPSQWSPVWFIKREPSQVFLAKFDMLHAASMWANLVNLAAVIMYVIALV